MSTSAEGTVKQIIGVVVDVDFSGQDLPPINTALEVKTEGDRLVLEVQQHPFATGFAF